MADQHHHQVLTPKPRRPNPLLVAVPTFKEAQSAIFDVSAALKRLCEPPDDPENFDIIDALEKRFFPHKKKTPAAASSTRTVHQESGPPEPSEAFIDDTVDTRTVTVSLEDPNPVHQESGLPGPLKACIEDTDQRPVTVSSSSDPNPAWQAFALLCDPKVQKVVASIVSDTNVWEAMKKNMEVLDYAESSETNKSHLNDSTTVTGGEIIPTDGSSGAEDGQISLVQTMKQRVLAIVRILSEFYHNIFGNLAAEEGSSSGKSTWKHTCISAPFMVLTIGVVIVVLAKRESKGL